MASRCGIRRHRRRTARLSRKAPGHWEARSSGTPGRGCWHQLLISGNGSRWHPAGVGAWLKRLGIFGQRSHEKRLPRPVFQLANRQVALLLRHLWATDGSISPRKPGTKGASRVFFSTSSRGLADDVAALLLRFGIVARIRETIHQRCRSVFSVDVSGADAQRAFLDHVGTFGPRVGPGEVLASRLSSLEANTNVDTLPQEVFEAVRATMGLRGVSQRAMAGMRGTSYGGSSHFRFAPGRDTVASYARLLNDDELARWAGSDLFWDRVVAIEPAGEEEVFDLTVPGPEFVARGRHRQPQLGRDRAGRGRHPLHLPRRGLQPRDAGKGHRRDHHRQAAQRPDRNRAPDLPGRAHALREFRVARQLLAPARVIRLSVAGAPDAITNDNEQP